MSSHAKRGPTPGPTDLAAMATAETLRSQRNQALDHIATLAGQIAGMAQAIAERDAAIAALEAKLAAATKPRTGEIHNGTTVNAEA